MYVTPEEIRSARGVCLFDYVESCCPELFKKVGCSLVMKRNQSLSIKRGYTGYKDFATNEHGNSVDFLVRHLSFSFPEAVTKLNEFARKTPDSKPAPSQKAAFPVSAVLPFKRVCSYLEHRSIPQTIVDTMIQRGILYEEENTGNAVFINPEHTYCEIRGTYRTEGAPFHGCRKTKPDQFWYFCDLSGEKPNRAYICEGAIDAVSLMMIHVYEHDPDCYPCVYISIGGVSNQKTIDRIKSRIYTILAVDNDAAGEECRKRNPDIPSIIPKGKDWNDDLIALIESFRNEK